MGARKERPDLGFTLIEALLVVTLTAFATSVGWKLFSSCRTAGMRVAVAAEGLETVRTAAWLLGEELRGSIRGQDRWSEGGDSVSLRAYRGFALVSGPEVGGGWRVCYRGLRAPDPAKDSVLFLTHEGVWVAHELRSRVRSKADCMGGGESWEEVWEVSPELPGGVVGRLFERGSYHLTDGALRYRRGAGGRQPVTPTRLASAEFSEGEGPSGYIAWELFLANPWGAEDSLSWSGQIR